MIYQEAAVAMEKITRELRSAEWFTMNWNYPGYSIYFCKSQPSAMVMDQNRYVLYLKPANGTKLYRFSRSTSSGFSDWVWDPMLSANNVIADNVSTFSIVAVSVTPPYLNVTIQIILEMEDVNLTALLNISNNPSYHYLVRMESTVSPKNLQSNSCASYPFLLCGPFGNNYTNRNYNGDYEDVVQ